MSKRRIVDHYSAGMLSQPTLKLTLRGFEGITQQVCVLVFVH